MEVLENFRAILDQVPRGAERRDLDDMVEYFTTLGVGRSKSGADVEADEESLNRQGAFLTGQ